MHDAASHCQLLRRTRHAVYQVLSAVTPSRHRSGAHHQVHMQRAMWTPREVLFHEHISADSSPFHRMPAAQSVFGRSHTRQKLTGFITHTTMYFLALAYTAALCINLFGCVFYFTARVEGIANGNTWLSAVGASDMPPHGLLEIQPVLAAVFTYKALPAVSLHGSGGGILTHQWRP